MLPRVSVPMAKPTQPAAVADPGPADEPLDPCSGVPRVAGAAAVPDIAHGQRAECELGDEHSPGFVEALHDGSVALELLVPIRRSAPARGIALDREQVLRAPGNAVQRATRVAGGQFTIGHGRLPTRPLRRARDLEQQVGIVALQP